MKSSEMYSAYISWSGSFPTVWWLHDSETYLSTSVGKFIFHVSKTIPYL
jgi:hypothetical protein